MPIITMTTDFGVQDGFVGVMKGVILGIVPEVQIVDLSHHIPPQNILQGARLLRRHAGYFPPGTVHLAVVDPGVGTSRRPLAACINAQFFVAPDNGLLSPLIMEARETGNKAEIVHLNNPAFWLPTVSHTFHGRDIFAPCAAHLAGGAQISNLGVPIDDPVLIELPQPGRIQGGWRAQVIGIDVFGNLATNLSADTLEADRLILKIRGETVSGLAASYGERNAGELVALIDSEGFLEVAVVNGSAARRLGAVVGDEVLVDN